MKKLIILGTIIIMLFVTGCGKKDAGDIIKDLDKKVSSATSYQVEGRLQITNNDDTYNYDVTVSYQKPNKYRVSLVNTSNDHEQIILKNDEGVYVVTPSLNKSFKFQSDWPNNNSQVYLLNSIISDVNNDGDRIFEENKEGYMITTKVTYPNNTNLIKQKITMDKNLMFKTIEVLDSNDIPQMVMKFNSIDLKANFDDDFFDLDSIIEQIDTNVEEKTEESNAIDDIIYPLYIPMGTSLVDKEKVAKTDGERIILTFDGEKPFLLVEETVSIEEEFSVIPTYGDPLLLADTVAALSSNSISWVSNGIEYYIVSDAMSQVELIEIASSINTVATIK
ncbi:MAG: outer membrane lipoprotein carrier protein LolA [Bacilli bacterium]|nr:outer membrane lipoprotein carrier protein LolA [Bacilli bacterium]